MRFKKIDSMKKLVFIVLLYLPLLSFSQEYIDDSNFDDKINEQSAFGDDETNIVVIEFWAKFNEANAFADWNKVEGVKYYRVDIAKAPAAKKEYRVRMAPTIIIFKDGINEESFKAGLDLECPVTLDELVEAVEEVKTANQF
jgi:thioredoxin-like negative regulator of GroEL